MKKAHYPLLPGIDDDDVPFGRKEPPEEQPPPVAKEFRRPRHDDLSLYICHPHEGERIFQRKSDGYFDATAMCRAYGKLWGAYKHDRLTPDYVADLESDIGISISLLIESNRSGPYKTRGTWVHPEIAVDLAQYLNPRFRIKVNRLVIRWAVERSSLGDIEPFVIGRMLKDIAEEQQRHTGLLQHIDLNTTQTKAESWRQDKEEQSQTIVVQSESPPSSSGRPKKSWDDVNQMIASPSREAGR